MVVALAFCMGIGLARAGIPPTGALLLASLAALIAPWRRPQPRLPGWPLLTLVTAAGLLHASSVGAGREVDSEQGFAVAQDSDEAKGGVHIDVREALQRQVTARIHRRFPTEGGMVAALTLADRTGVSWEDRDAFRRSGTTHLLAISGFHVGVIAGWLLLLMRFLRIPLPRALVISVSMVWGYVALLGFPGSASRAATLFTLVSVGRILQRPVRSLGAWGTGLLLMAVVSPSQVLRVGTQLSFLGVLGLILWADKWSSWMDRRLAVHLDLGTPHSRTRRAAAAIVAALGASAAAQWATLPLAAWSFQQIPLAGLPATLIATPLVSFALPGVLVTLVMDGLSIPGVEVLAAGVETLLTVLRAVVSWAASWGPVVRVTPWSVGVAILSGLVSQPMYRWLLPTRRPPAGLLPAAVLAAGLLAAPMSQHLSGRGAEFHFLDVGQGDGIVVRTPNGRWIVVDTGPPSGERFVRDLLRLGVSRIDALFLSHPDLDHIGGAAAVLRSLPVGFVVDPVSVRGGAWTEVLDVARSRGVEWRAGTRGDVFVIDDVRLELLHPSTRSSQGTSLSVNDRSLVVLASLGEFDALLTGDISMEVEDLLLSHPDPALRQVEVLKVGHHGSRTSTGAELLARLRPEIAVIQVGRANRFGHPEAGVLERLRGIDARILRTDLHRSIRIRVSEDGRTYETTVESSGLD